MKISQKPIILLIVFIGSAVYSFEGNFRKYRFYQNLNLVELNDPANFIKEFSAQNPAVCNIECKLTNGCSLFSHNTADKTCRIYRREASVAKLEYSENVNMYAFDQSLSLTNFWPMEGSMKDVIGHMDMTPVLNCEFTSDRMNEPNSALLLKQGYANFPTGTYFDMKNSGFTIMLWVNLMSQEFQQRIFSSGDGINEIFRLNCLGNSRRLRYLNISSGKTISDIILPEDLALDLKRWYHLAVTINASRAILYVDGVQLGTDDRGLLKLIFILGINLRFEILFKKRA